MTMRGEASDGDRVEDEDGSVVGEPLKPSRPGLIEFAAAVLIVGGILGVLGALFTLGSQPVGLEGLPLLTLTLNLAEVAVGVAIRFGWLWLLAVNYVAVLAFLDLLAAGANPASLMLGVAEVVVVVILLTQRPWFEALRRWRAAT